MKLSLIFIISTFVIFTISAQIPFSSENIIFEETEEESYSPKDFVTIDLDGDNDLDIVVLNQVYLSLGSFQSNPLFWYENIDGLGNFGPGQLIGEGKYTAITAGDIDNDGDQDVVAFEMITLETTGAVIVFQNEDNTGVFTETQMPEYTIDGAFYSLLGVNTINLVDINNNGRLDVLCGLSVSNLFEGPSAIWFKNTGASSGVFLGNGQTFHTTNSGVRDIFSHIIDYDNDGDKDILLEHKFGDGQYSHWITINFWLYENVNGSYSSSPVDISVPTNNNGAICLTEIDNDGELELVINDMGYDNSLDNTYSAIYWYQAEDNSFVEETTIINHDLTFPTFGVGIISSDLDFDGDNDVIFVQGDEIVYSLNADNGNNFGESQLIFKIDEGEDNIHLFVTIKMADLNGDGVDDVVYSSSGNKTVGWMENLSELPQKVSGTVFFDENENQIQDMDEVGLVNFPVTFLPSGLTLYSDAAGNYEYSFESNEYTVSVQTLDNWELTMDSANYTINLEDMPIGDLNFGFKPTQSIHEIVPTIASAITRCNTEIPLYLNYDNVGTTFSTGYVSFTPDPLTSFVSANPSPDSIDNNVFFWKYDNLPPTYTDLIRINLQMPGVNSIGDELIFSTTIYVEDTEGNLVNNNTGSYSSVITCAYDPNDKLVEPSYENHENYIFMEDSLIYTIRFQNTGTDTAFNIQILDQLDANLDWNSLKILGASHDYRILIDGFGKVTYFFDDILLPDSTTNEIASHGFIKYRIKMLEDLPENTEIFNTAHIIFDSNPPIITNTVKNILVSEFPVFADISNTKCHDSDDGTIAVNFPDDSFLFNWENGAVTSNLTDLSIGEYFVTITNEEGKFIADTSFIIEAPEEILLLTNSLPTTTTDADGVAVVISTGGTAPFTYLWDTEPVQTTSIAVDLSGGDYSVTVTDANGCTAITEVTVDLLDNVHNKDFVTSFDVIPNPSNGTAFVHFGLKQYTEWELSVNNTLGQTVKEVTARNFSGLQEKIEINDLSSGIYLINLRIKDFIITKKLVVVGN